MVAALPLRPWLNKLLSVLGLDAPSANKDAGVLPKATHSNKTNSNTTLARGHQAETDAADYLMGQGLQLLDRNMRAGRGEIDLIMLQGKTLVFVEVRARKVHAHVSAIESISRSKRRKIIETAERLLNEKPEWRTRACRFDVIGIQFADGNQPAELEWIQDAFQAE